MANPQTLNLYAYVENNPSNSTDLDGHFDLTMSDMALATGYEYQQLEELSSTLSAWGDEQEGAMLELADAAQPAQQQPTQQQMGGSPMPNLGPPPMLPTDITIIPTFRGSDSDVAKLKAGWSELMQYGTARADARIATLNDGSIQINSATNNAFWNHNDRSINVDPNWHPQSETTAGWQRTPTSIMLGHELGHKVSRDGDTGPGNMDNVNTFENPIRRDLGMPARIGYPIRE